MVTATSAPTLRLFPVEFGYGPLGKALHIARAIRRLVVPELLRLELVVGKSLRAPVEDGLFDAVRSGLDQCPPADLTLTIMNSAGAHACASRGERVFVVDSLAWLWDAPLPVGELADRYYYQSIPVLPVPDRNIDGFRDARAIPAIVETTFPATAKPTPETHKNSLLLSLSGLTNPFSKKRPFLLNAYLQLVLNGVVDMTFGEMDEEPHLSIYGNPDVLRENLPESINEAIRSGRQIDFLADAQRHGSVVAAPGLTTILECIANNIPLSLLPPQNYSQAKISHAFIAAGIPGITWDSPLLSWAVDATLPEHLGVEIVNGVVSSQWGARQYIEADGLLQLKKLATVVPEPSRLVGETNGAETIATDILEELC